MTLTLTEHIKRECGDRLVDVLRDYETQINLTAHSTRLLKSVVIDGATLTAEEIGSLSMADAIHNWVIAMRTVQATLIANQDATYANDSHWPAPPPGAQAFISQF